MIITIIPTHVQSIQIIKWNSLYDNNYNPYTCTINSNNKVEFTRSIMRKAYICYRLIVSVSAYGLPNIVLLY